MTLCTYITLSITRGTGGLVIMLRRRVSDQEGAKTKNQFTSRVTDLEDTFLRAIHCTLHCRGTRFTNPKKKTIVQYCLSLCDSAILSCVRSPMIGSGKKRFQDAIMLIAHKTLRNIEHPRAESSSTLRNSHLVSWKWRDLPWIGYLKILLAWRTLLVCENSAAQIVCTDLPRYAFQNLRYCTHIPPSSAIVMGRLKLLVKAHLALRSLARVYIPHYRIWDVAHIFHHPLLLSLWVGLGIGWGGLYGSTKSSLGSSLRLFITRQARYRAELRGG